MSRHDRKRSRFAACCALGAWAALAPWATAADSDNGPAVKITPQLDGVTVEHAGKPVRIERNQDTGNLITPDFQRTSRRCPPFCIQPVRIAPGVETIGEVELLAYLQRIADGDQRVLLIDSRGPDWVRRGTIPGAINLHYKRLSLRSASDSDIAALLEGTFGARRNGELWNFASAKTLVLFCNGPWCGQSPTNIRSLLRLGYPAAKLKWYRGGLQDWEVLGLTKVAPE